MNPLNLNPKLLDQAIMKLLCTEKGRVAINEAMDVAGGAGISKGKANFLASAYTAVPIAITVEGANALTRSMMIYGQGLTRSHPHLLKLVQVFLHPTLHTRHPIP